MVKISIKVIFTKAVMVKSSFKCFIGYNDNDDIRPLCKKLPHMIEHAKYFNTNKIKAIKKVY